MARKQEGSLRGAGAPQEGRGAGPAYLNSRTLGWESESLEGLGAGEKGEQGLVTGKAPQRRGAGRRTAQRASPSRYLGELQARLPAHVLAELVHGRRDGLLRPPQGRLALVAGPQQVLVVHQVDGAPGQAALDEEPADGAGPQAQGTRRPPSPPGGHAGPGARREARAPSLGLTALGRHCAGQSPSL